MRIDPKLIIEFAAIAEEGSFTRAAKRLSVAQPWLSARLGKLEALLGFRLFDRTTRTVSLTARGEEFLRVARDMAKVSEDADRLALQLSRKHNGLVRIGAAPYTKVIGIRHELLDNFVLAQPDLRLEMETGWSLPLLNALRTGAIDLSFMMGDVDRSEFDSIVFRHYGLALTVEGSHPWAKAKSISPGLLTDKAVQVFTRSLNPGLWDALYAPLVAAGANFVEMPEMAEGSPDRLRGDDDVAAFFDFGADEPAHPHLVRIPVAAKVEVPFQLLRHSAAKSENGQIFWKLAQRYRHPG